MDMRGIVRAAGMLLLCSLAACQKQDMTHEPTFTLVKRGRYVYAFGDKDDGTVGDMYRYEEVILIDSMPKNFVKKSREKLKRLMIYHYLRLTSSIDSLKMYADFDMAIVRFVKMTPDTREYYIDGRKCDCEYGENGVVNHETYVGSLDMSYCKTGDTNRILEINVNLGGTDNNPMRVFDLETDTLLNECVPSWHSWHRANKYNDLVKYYMELRNR